MPCLDAGFFIGRNYMLIFLEGEMVPNSFIEVKDSTSFFGELGITGKNPRTITPRFDGIFMKPSPYSTIADRRSYACLSDISSKVGSAPSRNGDFMNCRDFASNGLNLNYQIWGGKPGADPGEGALQGPPDVVQRTVFSTC